jgi:hypothetical protein
MVVARAGIGTGFLFDSVVLRALPVAAGLVLASKPLLDRRVGLPYRDDRMFATGLGIALLGVVLGLATAAMLDHPLVHASECTWWVGYDNPGAMTLPMAVAVVAGGGATAALVVGAAAAAALAPAERRWTRPVAWVASATAAALVFASAAAWWQRPDPSLGAYVASLPEIGRLRHPYDASESDLDLGAAPWSWKTIDGPEPVLGAEVAGLEVWRIGSHLVMAPDGGSAPGVDELGRRGALFEPGRSSTSIRRDAARGLVILGHGVHDDIGARAAFREPELRAVDVRLADLRGLTGPPPAWIAAACAGLVVALLALGDRRGSPLARERDQRPGRADGHGFIELDDGSARVPVLEGQAVPRGPVVVIPLGPAREATYREVGGLGPVLVVPGTVATLRAAVDAAAANRAMLALAALALTSAPLVAAWWHGLCAFLPR